MAVEELRIKGSIAAHIVPKTHSVDAQLQQGGIGEMLDVPSPVVAEVRHQGMGGVEDARAVHRHPGAIVREGVRRVAPAHREEESGVVGEEAPSEVVGTHEWAAQQCQAVRTGIGGGAYGGGHLRKLHTKLKDAGLV